MSKLPHAGNFRELIVHQKARSLSSEIFHISKSFPKEEAFSLTNQVRRSSRSIGAQIAEAWGKRRYENHFISKLTDSDAEQYETQHWLMTAKDCGYLSELDAHAMTRQCEEIGRMLNGMISKSRHFCGSQPETIRESVLEYLIDLNEE